MRRRFRFDPDLDAVVEIRADNFFIEGKLHVIGDDVGAGVKGLRHMASGKYFDSKSQHRAESKARGLEEVGTEKNFASAKAGHSYAEYQTMVSDARQQIAGNWQGTADWLRRVNEQGRK